MIYLRQSTASQEIPLGYFVDSTDGDTEETALTIANTDIKIWKTGATTLASKNSGGGTHISNGIYYATLDATDTNTIGPMVVFCHVSGALATKTFCTVLDETVYDVMFGTTALSTVAAGAAMTLTSAYDFAKGTSAMTEAYAANGVAPTPVQALMAIHQVLMQFAISGTSYTVKKLDNSTTAFTVTLDSSSSPTSAVRT